MLFTDTWDYHWGAEGVIRHTGNIWGLEWPGQPPEGLAWQYFIANIHYATQTQWWVLKLKTICWQFWREECPGSKGTKETYGVFGMKFYHFFIEASIYWVSTICSEDICITPEHSPLCITPEHSPLWPSDFILHLILDDYWFRKWFVTCSVPSHYLNQHCLTPSRPLGPTEETLATRIKITYN